MKTTWEPVGQGSEGIAAGRGNRGVVIRIDRGDEVSALFIIENNIVDVVDYTSIREAKEAGEKFLNSGELP